jgi:hypothetical protein
MIAEPNRAQRRLPRPGRLGTVLFSIAAVIIVFVGMLIVFWATERYFDWPRSDRERLVATGIAIGVTLLVLVPYVFVPAFQFLSRNQGKLAISAAWASFSIDLSNAAKEAVAATPHLTVSENFLRPELAAYPADSGSDEVVQVVRRTAAATVVTIDLAAGRSWWTTRLFLLAAGAVRYGTTKAIAFVSTRANVDNIFIGWAEPQPILDALMDTFPEFATHYVAALSINQQLLAAYPAAQVYPGVQLHPGPGGQACPVVSAEALRYQHAFHQNPEYAFMQMLMGRLSTLESDPPVVAGVQQPRVSSLWITRHRVDDLFGAFLNTSSIDVSAAGDDQVTAIVQSQAAFIAVTRGEQLLGLANVDWTVRRLIGELFRTQSEAAKGGGD